MGQIRLQRAESIQQHPDLPLLDHVGVSFAVANAVDSLRDYCDFTTTAMGGFGAVREICEMVLSARGNAP